MEADFRICVKAAARTKTIKKSRNSSDSFRIRDDVMKGDEGGGVSYIKSPLDREEGPVGP